MNGLILTWTGANTIDPYAFADLLVGQTPSESYNRSLCRCIVKEITSANVMVNRRTVDYSRTPLHMRQGVLGKVIEWVDIGIE